MEILHSQSHLRHWTSTYTSSQLSSYTRYTSPETQIIDFFECICDPFMHRFHADLKQRGEYHFWMAAIFENMRVAACLRCIRQIPPLYTVLVAITKMSPAIAKLKNRLADDTKDKTMRRVHSKTDRKDLMRCEQPLRSHKHT